MLYFINGNFLSLYFCVKFMKLITSHNIFFYIKPFWLAFRTVFNKYLLKLFFNNNLFYKLFKLPVSNFLFTFNEWKIKKPFQVMFVDANMHCFLYKMTNLVKIEFLIFIKCLREEVCCSFVKSIKWIINIENITYLFLRVLKKWIVKYLITINFFQYLS